MIRAHVEVGKNIRGAVVHNVRIRSLLRKAYQIKAQANFNQR